jgi:hypothetical protein
MSLRVTEKGCSRKDDLNVLANLELFSRTWRLLDGNSWLRTLNRRCIGKYQYICCADDFGDAFTAGAGITFLGYLDPDNDARELVYNFSPSGRSPEDRPNPLLFKGHSRSINRLIV